MAADAGHPARSVAERLFDEPHAFEFAQAVRLLELLRPGAVPLGTGLDPRAEALGLMGALAPVFAPSALGAVREAPLRSLTAPAVDEPPQPQLEVNAFGLGGPEGPLPDTYLEWLQDRVRNKDTSAVAFLNLFQHRLLALLYRAQRKYRVADPYLEPDRSTAQTVLRGLSGLLLSARRHAAPAGIDAHAVLARAGLFANSRRSLAGFDVMACHHFGLPMRSSPFAGGWREIAAASQTRIGRQGRNHRLGTGAVAGTRIWDEHRGIGIRIGPLALGDYESFLPGGGRHTELRGLAAAYFGADLYLHVELHLAAGQQPRARLSKAVPPRLGWTAWAGAGAIPPARTARMTLRGGSGAA
ncbi:type VI secretion system baseplate subunit TssG [Trinickia violacea]|uniref:Type VI secretion system baseplate subunit TssG n=1 Tax=Trinickia violacea TaxID=2571746 RepID=A0A4P8IWE6_9BURK|nr:type VI secretion system baseplate subunit TssG [Trinickia violacea]QCP53532.1 type VI secretion system baseplate subunit TssG [Trinickia violacea]